MSGGDAYGTDNTQQNKRCSSVFRSNYDNSTANDIDGKLWSDNGGITWFHRGGVDNITYITFPYKVPEKPELVYLDEDGENEIFGEDITILREKSRKRFDEMHMEEENK